MDANVPRFDLDRNVEYKHGLMERRVDWLMLGNAMLCSFFVAVGYMIFVVSLPTLAQKLGADLIAISWALISYQLATISLSLVFGRVGDLYGRHAVFGTGIAVFTIGSFLCGLAQDVYQLIGFRVLQGIGGAMCQSQARALAMESVDAAAAGKAQALMTTAHYAGFLFGPSLGGIIIDFIHWRGIFFLLVPIGVAGLALNRFQQKQSLRPAAARKRTSAFAIDYPGASLLVVSTVALIALLDRRLMEAISWGWRNFLILGFAGSFVGFILQERAAASPILNLELFKSRGFTLSALSLLLVTITQTATAFVLPFYLQEVLRLSPTFMGVLFISGSICTAAVSPFGGYLADKVGTRLPATTGLILVIAASAMGTLVQPDSHWLLPTLILAIGGLGLALFYPQNHATMIGSAPKEHRGVATGALFMTFGLGNAVGVSMGSFLMTVVFRYLTGDSAATPTPEMAKVFVGAMNYTFAGVTAVAVCALISSLLREKGARGHPQLS
ncbi:MAG: MFS transporter [Deltaproteobacteria bacterium]|nr:MFS transporter [Deltaproteobacteria bacterium]